MGGERKRMDLTFLCKGTALITEPYRRVEHRLPEEFPGKFGYRRTKTRVVIAIKKKKKRQTVYILDTKRGWEGRERSQIEIQLQEVKLLGPYS